MNDTQQDRLKDYIPVNERLMLFWRDHPDGRVETELIRVDAGVVIVKASLFVPNDDGKPLATGHAHEREDSSYINKTSALENCETSAVGRALALAGYEIKKSIASKEEVENAMAKQARIVAGEEICNECGAPLTIAVAKYSKEKLGQPLCLKHQKLRAQSA